MDEPSDVAWRDIDEHALLEDLQHLSGIAWAHQVQLNKVMNRSAVRLALFAARPLRPAYRWARAVKRILQVLTARSVNRGDSFGSPFDDRAYEAWLAASNGLSNPSAGAPVGPPATETPLFAIVMPVCDPPIAFLREAIDSVLRQTFRHLQLVLVDDGCTDEAVVAHLRKIALSDDRVALVRNHQRRGIGIATELGIRNSESEWVGFVDHDDILRPQALSVCARVISESQTLAVVFTDEDKITADGRRFHPRFKSAFDPVRLLHENYLNHFFALRRSLLEDSKGSLLGVEGAQDWNLALTVTRRVERHQVGHIPYVGYSWRQSEGQFSQQRSSSAIEAASRVLQGHFDEIGSELLPRPHAHLGGALRLVAPPGVARPGVTAIVSVLATGTAAHRRTVQNISAWLGVGCKRIIVLCSAEATRRLIEQNVGTGAHVTVKKTTTSRLGVALAEGLADEPCGTGRYLILGEEVGPIGRSVLGVLSAYLALPNVGMVGPRMLGPGAHLENAGALLADAGVEYVGRGLDPFSSGYFGDALIPHEVAALDPRALLLDTQVFHDLFNDVNGDLGIDAVEHQLAQGCWRRGMGVVFVPSVSVLRRERDGDRAEVAGETSGRCAESHDMWMRAMGSSEFPGAPRLPSALEVHGSSYLLRQRHRPGEERSC